LKVRILQIKSKVGILILPLAMALLPTVALALITQGYHYSGTVLDGGLVASDQSDVSAVVLASNANSDKMIGVMVPPGSSEITISKSGQVQVASSGTVAVDVSDEFGDIHKGDYVTASDIAGVGAKATRSGRVIGVAEDDFTGLEAGDAKTSVKGKQVALGQIPVSLYVGTVDISSNGSGAQVPSSLEHLAEAVAGHQVSALRLILAVVILVGGLVAVAVILYGAVSNSFLSIGRNPLAKHSVYQGLFQVSGLALGLLALCALTMYLVVRL
jgi:hypothetical protein